MKRIPSLLLIIMLATFASAAATGEPDVRNAEPRIPAVDGQGVVITSSSSSLVLATRETAGLDTFVLYGGPDHPTEGKIVMPDIPVRFDRTAGNLDRLQPKLGQHSIEVLREMGLGDDEIETMLADGATQGRTDS